MQWRNSVTIDAPAFVVWQLTVDVERWPLFTKTMQRVERLDQGPFRIGSSARIKQPGQRAAVWTVTRFVDGREFAWQTRRMGMTMTGSHLVEDVGTGCRNTLSIEIEGGGSRLFGLVFGGALRKALAVENAGFRAKAQSARPSEGAGGEDSQRPNV
jgi:uncharacterized membrane protein